MLLLARHTRKTPLEAILLVLLAGCEQGRAARTCDGRSHAARAAPPPGPRPGQGRDQVRLRSGLTLSDLLNSAQNSFALDVQPPQALSEEVRPILFRHDVLDRKQTELHEILEKSHPQVERLGRGASSVAHAALRVREHGAVVDAELQLPLSPAGILME